MKKIFLALTLLTFLIPSISFSFSWNNSSSGDMKASDYSTTGKIKQSKGGTGIDSSTSTGYCSLSAGTWSFLDAAGMKAALGYYTTTDTLDVTKVSASLTASGTGATLTAPRQIYYCTNTCAVDLPNGPAAGTSYTFCIVNLPGVATAITINAAANRYYGKPDGSAYGTQSTGTLSCTAAVGNAICVSSVDATHYAVISYSGTCTAN